MDLSIDGGKVLYAVGALLGIVTVAYFGFEFLAALSPTVKSILLVFAFAAFLLGGLTTERSGLSAVGYVLAAGSYLVWLAYTFSRFELGETAVLLTLACSTLLFVGLGYVVRERSPSIARRQALAVVGVLVVLSLGLIAVDAVGAQPSYEIETVDSVDAPEPRERVDLGTVTATNEFVLSRAVDDASVRICVTGPEPREFQQGLFRDTVLGGGDTATEELTISGNFLYGNGPDGDPEPLFEGDSIPVETSDGADCPTDDELRIVVLTDGLSN